MYSKEKNIYASLYDIPVETIEGTIKNLREYQGQVLLIVNVASFCGFTSQYKALEALYQKYKSKQFTILAFPCNQFFKQEPGSAKEITTVARECYRIHFPLFAKINVKGPFISPLYQYLKQNIEKKPLCFVPWNFTKILVNQYGSILQQYYPFQSLKKVEKDIEAAIRGNRKN